MEVLSQIRYGSRYVTIRICLRMLLPGVRTALIWRKAGRCSSPTACGSAADFLKVSDCGQQPADCSRMSMINEDAREPRLSAMDFGNSTMEVTRKLSGGRSEERRVGKECRARWSRCH